MAKLDTPISEGEKRDALAAVLNSGAFARSAQLRALLRYICERDLSGHPEDLTEYQIAVDVLGRRKDFSLTDDSTVRNRAYELRQRLEKFYSSERPDAAVRIDIPRGGYVPVYTRHHPTAALEPLIHLPRKGRPTPAGPAPRRLAAVILASIAIACGLGVAAGYLFFGHPGPPGILREAWGPLADPADPLLISIATNLHMIVRPHIPRHPWRFDAPDQMGTIYGPARPRQPDAPLYMEPAQLSVPLAEAAGVVTLANLRTAFGGSYQLLPESEAPVAALRGRDSVLLGSGTNSQAATVLLRTMPFTIDFTGDDRFAVFDRRKPAGENMLFLSQPTGSPVPSVLYGLLTIITTPDPSGKIKRTLVISGSGSAGVQAAAEFFCSADRMREMKQRFREAGLNGFPPAYQFVVRAKTAGLRLISYEYVTHVVVGKPLEQAP